MRGYGVVSAVILVGCAQPRAPIVASDAIDVMPDLGPADAGREEPDSGAPVVVATQEPATTTTDAAQIVARVEAVYVPPFELDFDEEIFLRAYGVKKQTSGHISLAAVGRVNVTYKTKQRIVAANGTQTIEDPSGPSYYSRPVANDFCPGAVAFASPGTITSRLTLETADGAQMSAPGTVLLVGRSRSPLLTHALYYVDKSSSEVKRVLFVDGAGNRTRYDFSRVAKNPRLAPSLFRPTPGIAFTPLGVGPGAPSIASPLP